MCAGTESYNESRRTQIGQRGALESLSSLAAGGWRGLSARFSHPVVARASRCGRPVGEWASGYPSVIRGSVAARSNNYAATRHISLPMTAKQGLETYRETV